MKSMGDKIVANVAQQNACSVKLDGFEVSGLKAKVRLTVASATSSKNTILASANALFGGSLRVIPRSFKVESSNAHAGIYTITGYAHLNKEMKSADEASKMRAVASNMFMDASDNIWKQHGTTLFKDNNIETSEALEELLTSVASTQARNRSMATIASAPSVEGGDLVHYASNGEMHLGFVVATDNANGKLLVLASDSDETEVIDRFDVNEEVSYDASELKEDNNAEVAGANAVADKSALVNYYKRLFGNHPEFFAQLEADINQHAYL